ncbi:hypothetical protein ANCDUO_10413 [Ancylostoma duodenale]|uniref:Major facilitator superfamily (MFS) profile domain-containing protein n=1 Tax=Ancylostoma duodenale TaxID=51022 RepID=A0A0C2DAL7_9BILA|nr:hypothetical protein ANCDUO_10413 [Ancylostoma duodenale]
MLSMGFLWFLSAMPTMSPAYLAPPTDSLENSTFLSVQEEFDLRRSLVDPAELTSSVYFLGNLVLGQMYCMAADRIGRRPVLVWSLIVSGLAGAAAAIAPNFYLMLLGRFIQGSFFNVSLKQNAFKSGHPCHILLFNRFRLLQSITMVNWVLCCESIAFKGHSYASVIFGVFWVAGYCIITPIARLFPSWRALQFMTSLPTLLFGLLMLAVVDFMIYNALSLTSTDVSDIFLISLNALDFEPVLHILGLAHPEC